MTLIYLGIGWLLGLIWGAFCPLRWPVWLLLSLLPLVAAILRRDERRAWRLYLALAFMLLGAARYRPAATAADSLSTYIGRGWGTYTGYVAEEPDPRADLTQLVLAVESARLEGQPPQAVTGRVLLEAPPYPVFAAGDRLRISGRLHLPPEYENFSYRAYLARHHIYALMRRPQIELLPGAGGSGLKRSLHSLKTVAQRTIQRILPAPESALLTGILLGNEQGIPARLMEAFNATGATHIIAISGFNISILAALLLTWLAALLPRRAAGLLTVGGIAVYTVLVGADASVVRAAVMGSLLVAGRLLGRRSFGPTSLSAAVIAMTAVNPLLIADLGFQLSVAATLGLMLVGELMPASRPPARTFLSQLARLLGESLLLTLAAQLATLPLLAYNFGRISPISPLTNLLIQPAQPPIMTLGGLATLAGLLWLPLGQLLGWLGYPFLWWTIRVVEASAQLPFASLQVTLSAGGAVAAYLLLAGLVWWAFRSGGLAGLWSSLARRLDLKVLAAAVAINLVLVIGLLGNRPDSRLHVTFLDVGEGEATLIETPSGRRILVDGGPDPATLLAHLGRRLPLWARSLDLVIATHPDYDHVNGLPPLLDSYQVGALMTSGAQSGLAAWAELLRRAEIAAIPLVTAESGQVVQVDDGVALEVLNPTRNSSGTGPDDPVVLRLAYGQVSFLLCSDIDAETELELIELGLLRPGTVLDLPDGGDRAGSSAALLDAYRPVLAILSVGERNPERHPAPQVLERLAERNIAVLRTDESGSIHLATDGSELEISTGQP